MEPSAPNASSALVALEAVTDPVAQAPGSDFWSSGSHTASGWVFWRFRGSEGSPTVVALDSDVSRERDSKDREDRCKRAASEVAADSSKGVNVA